MKPTRRPIELDPDSPITPFIERQGVLILDGGLATALEARGHRLDDELWSARLLMDEPEAIREIHREYLEAGADCIVSASYQASIAGFERRGVSEARAVETLRLSVALAVSARDAFWSALDNRRGRLRPLVAASVGPYGAYLADGSEYRGDYGVSEDALLAFHRRRWHVLAATRADLLACETIPSAVEARALARLTRETPERYAWFSFSCRDGAHINDGTPITLAVLPLLELPQVAAIGVNCTAPRHLPALIDAIRSVTGKPIVVYPNSGETFDLISRKWRGPAPVDAFVAASDDWRVQGAALIGGCCRVHARHIRELRAHLCEAG